ncbi:hypothetical protein Tco_0313240 [Tanacetum coccineum]
MGDDVDISTFTIEKSLALIQDNNRPGIVKPKISDDVEFKININFMRELRRKLFIGTDDEYAHEHVRRILEIVDLFYFPGVTHHAVMLRVFPITLKGRALRWEKRLRAGKLEEIRNFKQEMYETLYQAWERYNDLLFRFPQHDLNNHQKVQIFYTRLDISSRRMLDSRGLITLMTPNQALKSIQVMVDHSHNWYDETTTREKINNNPDNIDAIQASFKGAHLTKEYPLKKEDKTVEQREKRTIMVKGNMKEPVPHDLPPTPFVGHLKEQIGSPFRTRETVCMIENPNKVHKMKAQEDEGDIDASWDITVKDVERLMKLLTPIIYTLSNLKPVVQPYMPLGSVHDTEKIIREKEHDYNDVLKPLTPKAVHITPPNDDYVAPATNPILDKQLNEFGKECSDITRVAEKANGNPINDVQELSNIKKYDCETFI